MKFTEYISKNKIFDLKSFSLNRWIAYIGSILFFIQCLCFFGSIDVSNSKNIFLVVWISWFHFFTIQSNLIAGIFFILYWFKPNSKLANGNFLMYATGYILITFVVYSALLLPDYINSGEVANWDWIQWTTTLLQHFIIPLTAVFFYICYAITRKNDFRSCGYLKTIGLGMIYPTIYLTYAIVLPFISDYSIYGSFTNLNPELIIGGTPGSAFNLIYICGCFFAFILVIFIYRFFLRKNK